MTKKALPILLIILVSCVAKKGGFIVKQEKTEIRLSSITDQHKIGYETDFAIIYVGQLDAEDLTKNLLEGDKLRHDFKRNLDTISRINKDVTVIDWLSPESLKHTKENDLAKFIDFWILKDLILKGKAEVWNKSAKRYEAKIVYYFFEDRLGGESCSFAFQNGKVFHRQLIALGE